MEAALPSGYNINPVDYATSLSQQERRKVLMPSVSGWMVYYHLPRDWLDDDYSNIHCDDTAERKLKDKGQRTSSSVDLLPLEDLVLNAAAFFIWLDKQSHCTLSSVPKHYNQMWHSWNSGLSIQTRVVTRSSPAPLWSRWLIWSWFGVPTNWMSENKTGYLPTAKHCVFNPQNETNEGIKFANFVLGFDWCPQMRHKWSVFCQPNPSVHCSSTHSLCDLGFSLASLSRQRIAPSVGQGPNYHR